MDKQIQQERVRPDYKLIYNDLIEKKYPDKKKELKSLLEKEKLSVLDVIALDQRIFGKKDRIDDVLNQRHRSYDKPAILEILDYQKKNKLNNYELALKFKLSRNTLAKWKKIFLV